MSVNPSLNVDQYHLPRVEDILAKLEVSKIDLQLTYLQMELEELKDFTTINTHKSLYRFNHLTFGIASGNMPWNKSWWESRKPSVFLTIVLWPGPQWKSSWSKS